MKNPLVSKVVSKYHETSDVENLKEVVVGGDLMNEMVMFLKPEVFLNKSDDDVKKILDMVFDKLDKFEVVIDGASLISGNTLANHGIMDRHYGFINVMSRRASTEVDPEIRKDVLTKLKLDTETDYPILGGHELLGMYNLAPSELDELWSSSPSTKVKSGFYVRPFEIERKNYILVNGFHPQQLAHFTSSDRKMLVMLVKSNVDWAVLRNDMIGNTFPEQAILGSIRRTVYENAHDYGFDNVSISNNVVHLSAGPTEALFEINNFFKPLIGLDIQINQPKLVNMLTNEGMPLSDVLEILDNPYIELEDLQGDLHSLMEHRNLSEAVELWRKYKVR